MAIVWNSSECRRIASDLSASANKLESLLNSELEEAVNKGKNAYSSDAANEMFNKLNSLKSKSADFIDGVRKCSTTLTDEVAPAYEAVERKTATQ